MVHISQSQIKAVSTAGALQDIRIEYGFLCHIAISDLCQIHISLEGGDGIRRGGNGGVVGRSSRRKDIGGSLRHSGKGERGQLQIVRSTLITHIDANTSKGAHQFTRHGVGTRIQVYLLLQSQGIDFRLVADIVRTACRECDILRRLIVGQVAQIPFQRDARSGVIAVIGYGIELIRLGVIQLVEGDCRLGLVVVQLCILQLLMTLYHATTDQIYADAIHLLPITHQFGFGHIAIVVQILYATGGVRWRPESNGERSAPVRYIGQNIVLLAGDAQQ